MNFRVKYHNHQVDDEIRLPASKSESNRLLVLGFLSGNHTMLQNISEAGDTRVMIRNLQRMRQDTNDIIRLDCKDAGTVFRFLLSVCASRNGQYILDGSTRLRERPIAPLADALRLLGAEITYMEKEGFAPLHIKGKELQGSKVRIESVVSSQFISSLLLISPFLQNGLELELPDDPASVPYIQLTLSALDLFGVSYTWDKHIIKVKKGVTVPSVLQVENDWSSLSYFLPLLALKGGNMHVPGLKHDSSQGDKVMLEMMRYFGITAGWAEDGLHLSRSPLLWNIREFTVCFRHYPDLVPAFVVFLIAGGYSNIRFSGLESLKHKESDRTLVLAGMARNCGYDFSPQGDVWLLEKTGDEIPGILKVHEDHRMAMSFALLALKYGIVHLDDINCVSKSFPAYWQEMEKLGLRID